jgi:hypothetical protein
LTFFVAQLDAQLLEYKPQVEEVMEHGVKQNLETSALGLTFRVRAGLSISDKKVRTENSD